MTENNEATDFNDTETHREQDHNGYLLIKDNPITRAGVFQYKGSSLPGADPNRIYSVYRPLEELADPDTLASFTGLPIVDEHEMLGDRYDRSPEQRGVHGSILETVKLIGNDVVANLRIWSRTLKSLIDSGKKGLSLGYNCKFEKISGVFENMPYDYIQRNIRGNHLALVTQGRSGTEVLDKHDVFDHFDLALDTKELNMADDDKKDEKVETAEKVGENTEMSVADMQAAIKNLLPLLEQIDALRANKADPEMALDGDTEKKDGDQAKDEKDDKKDDKKDEKKDDKAMDSAEVAALVKREVSSATKGMTASIAAAQSLAKDLTPLVGTFDHSAMDVDDVAEYGVKKLGLKADRSSAKSVLSGYLEGMKKGSEGKGSVGFALDSAIAKPKEGGLLAKRLNA